jgi:Ca2+-binding EF-hand superfamily protein
MGIFPECNQSFMRFVAGDGSVNFIPDYLMEVSEPDYSTQTAREWFSLEDSNNDGFVSQDELIKIAVNIGMSMEEARQTAVGYYMSADMDGDNQLNWSGK